MSLLMGSQTASLPSVDMNRVKVIVAGEAGVGKSTLIHSLAGKPLRKPPWTVGSSVEVVLHSYRAGTPQESPYFIELWDIGGSRSHKSARRVFYQGIHGLILVHDLTNRKSQENLRAWISEILSCPRSGDAAGGSNSRLASSPFDGEQFATERDIPTLVVGSKLDQNSGHTHNAVTFRQLSKVASDCNADEIVMDCRECVSPGSTNGVKWAKFFDRVIDRQSSTAKRSATNAPMGLSQEYRRRHLNF